LGSGLLASTSGVVEGDKVLLVVNLSNESLWGLVVASLDGLFGSCEVNSLIGSGSSDERSLDLLDGSDQFHGVGEGLSTNLIDPDLVEVAVVNVIGEELGEASIALNLEPRGELLLVVVELLELVTGLEAVIFSELERVMDVVVLLLSGCEWLSKVSLSMRHVLVDSIC
jgi:hypothetical protein